jgi:hypothetical protein
MDNFTWITAYIYDNISLWLVFVFETEYVFSVVKPEVEDKVHDLNIITVISTGYTIYFRVPYKFTGYNRW